LEESNSSGNRLLVFALSGNSPNPFSDATTISYTIPRASPVKLDVYDSSGRLVRTLVNEEKIAGQYRVTWDGRDESGQAAASGIYFCSMQAAAFKTARKMVLLR
jgi:flagellar hook assembly protein FlgD